MERPARWEKSCTTSKFFFTIWAGEMISIGRKRITERRGWLRIRGNRQNKILKLKSVASQRAKWRSTQTTVNIDFDPLNTVKRFEFFIVFPPFLNGGDRCEPCCPV